MRILRQISLVMVLSLSLYGQGTLDPSRLLQPSADSWPMYNGDYSGRRFSTLSKLSVNNVNTLTLAWVYRANPGRGQAGGGGAAAAVIKASGGC
jgi:alcohol dehydrogenase (cytochrome c)